MFAPALIATAMSGVVMLLIKDTPEQMGFPPVDSGEDGMGWEVVMV